jgi:hypothetical protein
MGMTLRIGAESGLLRVIATGDFSSGEAERGFLEILDAVARHKANKILFDGRELKGDPEIMERFFYGTFVANAVVTYVIEHGVPRPQFAYVLKEPLLDPQRFGETVAVNRGMWVKAFDNLEAALEWLRLEPANKTNAGNA